MSARLLAAALVAAACWPCSAIAQNNTTRLVIKPAPAVADAARTVPSKAERNCRWRYADGVWSLLDERDRLIAQGNYREGQRHGKWVRWFAPGEGEMFAGELYEGFQPPMASEVEFVDGQIDGLWTVRDAQGRMASQWEFKNGRPDGTSTWWLPDGRLRQQAEFSAGKLNGRLLRWDADQNLIADTNFIDGQRATHAVAPRGQDQPGVDGWYVYPNETTLNTFDWWNGKAKTLVVRQDCPRQRHGRWTWWYNDHQKKLERTYDHGQPEGLFTWWYDTGEKQIQGHFSGGKQQGTFAWWYPTGQKHIEGQFAGGIESGRWRTWAPSGKLIASGDAEAVLKEARRHGPYQLELPPDDTAPDDAQPAPPVEQARRLQPIRAKR